MANSTPTANRSNMTPFGSAQNSYAQIPVYDAQENSETILQYILQGLQWLKQQIQYILQQAQHALQKMQYANTF